jgi:hypothetical protein
LVIEIGEVAVFLGLDVGKGEHHGRGLTPAGRTYYDRKRAQGKTHTQALLCLARRRIDVLFTMLRDGTFYESRPASAA